MEETISLKEIFNIIKKRFWMIAGITVGATIIAAIVSFFVLTPTYETSTQFIVNQQQQQDQNVNVNDIRTNVELINTYNIIIKSPAILDQVKEELDLDLKTQQLQNKLNVSSAQNSQVVTVTVQDQDPILAQDIANTTVRIFKAEIPSLMNVNNVNILSEANVAADIQPVSPRPMMNMAIAFVIGGMIGVGIAFLIAYLDNSIKNEEDIEQTLGLPVLGVVTKMSDEDMRGDPMKQQKMTSGRGETVGT